ncbi:hypothetical protein CPB83DRAFT_887063 [Crepidotus variabilis]|uniref:Uncharacterized protein n=1 Tax=Crepidotus variabilis TaxID=179855 RepID=A0A9P6E631_9AGAR|nr:hypothetical protein CPB83DRAFT_887063 [Crepidotus variabilis]
MRQRATFFAGIVLLILVSAGILYNLYSFLGNYAPVAMWSLSSTIQSSLGMNSNHLPFNNTSSTSRRIAVVMAIHQDTPLYRASIENHRSYCQLHGYHFMTQSKDFLPEAPFPQPRGNEYQKVAVLMQAMLIGLDESQFDWIFWTDMDTFVVNPSIPLESLLPPSDSSEKDTSFFLGNRDANGFNAGSFFIKVDPWSVQLLAMALAEPYLQYQSGAVAHPENSTIMLNDQASLGRIFQNHTMFGSHFHEIPARWANLYPPRDLDGKLDTSPPRLIPTKVENWVHAMEDAASSAPLTRARRAPTSPSYPPPLNQKTISHLKSLLDLPSDFLPTEFEGALQIHLVNYRKYQFYYNSLLVINAKFMQVGLAALVVNFHERLASAENADVIALWKSERDSSVWGLKYLQPTDLDERRSRWYRDTKAGVEGMKWLGR